MKAAAIISASAAVAFLPGVLAWPGMNKIMGDLDKKLKTRQDDDDGDSNEMIGDLVTPGPVTPVGKSVANIIVFQTEDGFDDTNFVDSYPGKNTKRCAADTCCIWSYIAKDLQRKFTGSSGRCNAWARAAIRQGFHDAGAWSKDSAWGGADGSLILNGTEINRAENNGLQKIIDYTQNNLYARYSRYGIGMADLIQFMATTAAVVCPLGPRTRTFVGRKDNYQAAPTGLLPDVHADAESLIELFENKTIRSSGLAALVGAHSTSQQQFVDTTKRFAPQDSTPGVFDILFYNQTNGHAKVPKRVFQFPSDIALAQHPETMGKFQEFENQTEWNEYYAREYVRLSLLGVRNINNLTECTQVLPARTAVFDMPDRPWVQKWLEVLPNTDPLGSIMETADQLTKSLLRSVGVSSS